MAVQTRLQLERPEVERILKYFLHSGHVNFHTIPEDDSALEETERKFDKWTIDVGEALRRCFTTPDIAERFEEPEPNPNAHSLNEHRLKILANAYARRRDYLKTLKGTLAMYEVEQSESRSTSSGKYTDRQLMERAIELARRCVSEPGKVSPKVGAIVARDGHILGEAYRGENKPGEHAEYTLLEGKLKDEVLAGATLFTTLEPCTSRNDPKVPCAVRIADRKIAKVLIGTLDRNEDIRGRGELKLVDSGIQIGRFDPDLMNSLDELNRDFIRNIRQRTNAETKDPVPEGEVGPNGFKIGYNEDGDKVEWVEEDGEVWPMVLRRNDNHILEEYAELQDRVWYVRKLIMFENFEKGTEERRSESEPFIQSALEKMKKMEEQYGAENLVYDDIEWGIIQGKMAALAWVLGSEWEGAFDT
jgi:pyrimidine deaminase RibD-like protein